MEEESEFDEEDGDKELGNNNGPTPLKPSVITSTMNKPSVVPTIILSFQASQQVIWEEKEAAECFVWKAWICSVHENIEAGIPKEFSGAKEEEVDDSVVLVDDGAVVLVDGAVVLVDGDGGIVVKEGLLNRGEDLEKREDMTDDIESSDDVCGFDGDEIPSTTTTIDSFRESLSFDCFDSLFSFNGDSLSFESLSFPLSLSFDSLSFPLSLSFLCSLSFMSSLLVSLLDDKKSPSVIPFNRFLLLDEDCTDVGGANDDVLDCNVCSLILSDDNLFDFS